jgi:hypothetical protein
VEGRSHGLIEGTIPASASSMEFIDVILRATKVSVINMLPI